MANLKRTASSPPNKEGKKTKEDDCLTFHQPATENILECIWCDGRLHAGCVGLSKDQCNVLIDVATNIVFFCSSCIQSLPAALKYYDN